MMFWCLVVPLKEETEELHVVQLKTEENCDQFLVSMDMPTIFITLDMLHREMHIVI
jgi:hypothetical protein